MSQTPQGLGGSRRYDDGWRAINELIRSGGSFSGHERKAVYRNLGNGKFADVSFLSGLDSDADGRAFAVLDMDGDGVLDLALKNRTAPQLRLMRNTLGGRSLIMELRGVRGNRDAIGARAILVTNQRRRMREVQSGSAYLSQSSRRLHFALIEGESIVELRIVWPGGGEQKVDKLPERGTILIEEGKGWQAIARPVHAPAAEAVVEETLRPWLVSPVPAPLIAKPATRWTMLNFAASWCPPCRTETADWKANGAALGAAGVTIRSVDVDKAANQDMVAAYSLLYRNLFDLRREMGLPMTFLIDASGAVVKIYQGLTLAREILADVRSSRRPSIPFAGFRITPGPARNWNDLAGALAEHGLTAPARFYFETALQRGDASNELRNNYAAVLMAAGDTARAERLLTGMREQPEALVNLGLLFLASSRPQQAIEPLERATRLQPDDGAAWGALGMAYSAAGKKVEAIAALDKAIRLGQGTANLANELGILYMETEQPQLAIAQFLSAVALDARHLQAHVNLVMYYLQSGDRAAARQWLTKAQAIDPRDEAVRKLALEIGR